MYEGHMDKAKGGRDQGWEVVMTEEVGCGGGKMETTVLKKNIPKEAGKQVGLSAVTDYFQQK